MNPRGLNLGTDTNYALIDLGNGTTLGWNSGPVAGNVLLGNGVTLGASGGGSVTNSGIVYHDSSVVNFNTLNQFGASTPPSQLVSGPTPASSVTGAALAVANSVAAFAAALTPTQTFTSITSTTTFTGSGGLNVINVGSIQNAPITISGGANDFFVINVSGSYNTNRPMTLTGGVTADHILWNFTGTSGAVFQTSGGDQTLYGTFLATDGGQFQFSNLGLDGELINTDGDIQLVSGSQIGTQAGFVTPLSSTPLPAALPLFATGLGAMGLFGWRRKRKNAIAA